MEFAKIKFHILSVYCFLNLNFIIPTCNILNFLVHNIEMVLNVCLMWSQGQGCLQASPGLLEVSAFHKHYTQVVLALDVVWINLQYPADRVVNTKCLVMRE